MHAWLRLQVTTTLSASSSTEQDVRLAPGKLCMHTAAQTSSGVRLSPVVPPELPELVASPPLVPIASPVEPPALVVGAPGIMPCCHCTYSSGVRSTVSVESKVSLSQPGNSGQAESSEANRTDSGIARRVWVCMRVSRSTARVPARGAGVESSGAGEQRSRDFALAPGAGPQARVRMANSMSQLGRIFRARVACPSGHVKWLAGSRLSRGGSAV